MKKWTREELTNSIPYKSGEFSRDSYELFRIHKSKNFSKDVRGMMIIWKDKIGGERSLFNKLNTNRIAYEVLINSALNKINDETCDPTTEEGYHKVIDFIKQDENFFNEILPELGKIIQATTAKGDLAEKNSEEIIKKFFPGCTIKSTAGLGKFTDMVLGIDKKVTVNGKEHNIQIKTAQHIYQKGDEVIVNCIGAKPYKNIEFFIFCLEGSKFFLFKNDTKAEGSKYTFAKSAFVGRQ